MSSFAHPLIVKKMAQGFKLVGFAADETSENREVANVTFYRHEPPSSAGLYAITAIREAESLLEDVIAGGPVRYFEEADC